MSDEQQSTTSEPAQAEESITLAQLLESVPPSQIRKIIPHITVQQFNNPVSEDWCNVRLPEIQLHCPSDICNRKGFFRAEDDAYIVRGPDWNFEYVHYKCGNCQEQTMGRRAPRQT